ncbi:hypothetical protein C7I87_02935 [Mesorhizobium sp. SARCC-RB16n]|uniref:hypothetical protein n=1 Tax=Mesorhizobium sp. SARCC-RB16n TaxID=2116687 RepID=UPI00122F7280|nr:hypothetical protein [Mesorhizobium sp. SARCC-RB16n]KAA3452344.1 hypothetical protein C7I87_02935 [Mesorhizobium sp. SARCC-RB16n]
MIEGRTALAQAVVDASFQSQHRSRAYIASIRGDIAQTRRAIAASHELLKRFRQRNIDEAVREAEWHRVSAFDADILRNVFKDLVSEGSVSKSEWRNLATSLVYEFTDCERVESALVDWIIKR